jgi:hypothetical protein
MALALLSHGAALLVLARVPQPGRSDPGPAAPLVEIRIEEAAPPPSTIAPAPASENSTGSREATAKAAGRVAGHGEHGAPAEAVALAPPSATDHPTPEGSAQPWTFSPLAAGTVWLGLTPPPGGGYRPLDGQGKDGPTRDPREATARRATDSVRAGLAAHDREVGMSPGGPLLEPTRDAVRSSLVPDFARAVLEFTTDRTGLVVSVRVLDSGSDRRAWDEVADKLAAETRKRPLRLPPGTSGLAVTMEVESKIIAPSANDPRKGAVSRVLSGLIDPTDMLMDSQAKPRRIVLARITEEHNL